jgi:hypothetical protein
MESRLACSNPWGTHNIILLRRKCPHDRSTVTRGNPMRDFAKNWKWTLGYVALVVVIIVIEEFRLDWIRVSSDFNLRHQVTDIADLMSTYCNQRIATGKWPDEKDLYATFFHLHSSTKTEKGRLDVFADTGTLPDGRWRARTTVVSFELSDDGHMFVNVKQPSP